MNQSGAPMAKVGLGLPPSPGFGRTGLRRPRIGTTHPSLRTPTPAPLPHRPARAERRALPAIVLAWLVLTLVPWTSAAAADAAEANWSTYLGDKGSSHYSALKQITPRNVSKLRAAWTYHAGGADPNHRSQIQCNPLIIDGVLYGTTPDLQAFALDAASGKEHWRFDPASVPGLSKAGV